MVTGYSLLQRSARSGCTYQPTLDFSTSPSFAILKRSCFVLLVCIRAAPAIWDGLMGAIASASTPRIVVRSLEEPLRQIAHNAGLEGSVVVNDVRKAKPTEGLNAATGEITDLIKAGVIDPAMVTRSALQNAASIGKNILTTEAIVAEVPEQNGGGGMPGMPGGMDGMM